MPQAIGREEVARMLRAAAREVIEQRAELSRLDSFGGDGDHGTTMARAMESVLAALDAAPAAGIKDLLQQAGSAIMGCDGGATGPLFGSFFLALAEGAAGETLDAAALAGACEAGLAGVKKNTRARLGDKTLIDALEPAVSALRAAASAGLEVLSALEHAAGAAAEGARASALLRARFGRAKNLGERSVGHEDPGALSVALIFRGLLLGGRSDG
ncbi:MAG: dihydroxyacetone kinase subunit L [Planctomycetes bacterium]|nr:dihydroxyacetone kinase subunit L [Planctomycetota bacterium]